MFKTIHIQGSGSRLTIWLIGFFCLWNVFSLKKFQNPDAIRHDMLSYYGYLPAHFIHGDLSLKFVNEENQHRYSWTKDAQNGKVFKMTMGVAVLNAPFFLVADNISRFFVMERSGFTPLYFFFIALSAIFYFIWGLSLLKKTISMIFDGNTAFWVVLIVGFGTNLYYYTFDEFEMSHVYNFFLFSLFIRYLILWHQFPDTRRSLVLGASMGLLVLIRPIHALAVVIFVLYRMFPLDQKLRFFRFNFRYFLVVTGMAFLAVLPQLLYWHDISGQWFFYSYGDERFYFNDPKIIEGLFSFRKGWLIYTPVMLFSLAGFVTLYRYSRELFIAIFPFFFAYIYVVFSWWCWWYGGSFGSRPMIDILPVMAIPLASFIYYFRNSRKLGGFWITVFTVVFIYLNIFQTRQYRSSLLHWDGMNATLYREIFLSNRFPENYDKMVTPPDYPAAMKGQRDN